MAAVVLQIKVKLRAKVSALAQNDDGSWTAHIKSPPVDGNANEELIALVAGQFRCRRAAVSFKTGAASRLKLVIVDV